MSKDRRFSLFTDDLENCIECKIQGEEPKEQSEKAAKHEIFFGNKHRGKSIKYGLVIPLCQQHHTGAGNKRERIPPGIHFNKPMDDYWKRKGQEKFIETYDEEFIDVFGRSYL